LIKEIQKQHLQRHYSKPKLKHLRQIAIDEISVGKGHRYVTLVLEPDRGAVVHVGEGNGGEALQPFWRRSRSPGAIKTMKRQAYGFREQEFLKFKIYAIHEAK
jgi:transposase